MSVLIRAGLLAAGLVWSVLAWHEWTHGVPPLWSFAAPRAETVVTRAELVEESDPGGRAVKKPHIYVAWPPGGAASEELAGLRSGDDLWHLKSDYADVRDHPAGSAIAVRVIDGHPVAARTSLRELGYALAASLLAILSTAGGLAWIVLAGAQRENA
jgi:hypothetical protein